MCGVRCRAGAAQSGEAANEALEGDDVLDALLGSDDDDAFASLAPPAPATPEPRTDPAATTARTSIDANAVAEVGG